jgi:hypothetical protein
MNEQLEQVIACACQLVARDKAVQQVELVLHHRPSSEELQRLHEQAGKSGLHMWVHEGHHGTTSCIWLNEKLELL